MHGETVKKKVLCMLYST